MVIDGSISKVIETDRRITFEWNIENFIFYPVGNFYESPIVHLSDSSWNLVLFPVSEAYHSEEWTVLQLNRLDEGRDQTITFTLGIRHTMDSVSLTFSDTFSFDEYQCSYTKSFSESSTFQRLFRFSKKMTVTCCMELQSFEEEKTFVSVAIQTEIPEGVLENEKSRDGNWSSQDTKGVALLSDCMKDLLVKGSDYDVTISIKNKQFRAHRNILCARSPVFAMMFTHDTNEKNTNTISIEDCDPDSFDEFLLYVYSGRTENLTPSNAFQLYYTADKYDFPVLKEWCVSLLKECLSITSICDVILLAAKHEENELLKVATEFFARNMKEILITVQWQNFLSQNHVVANELYIKSMEILLPKK